jgi:O-antigen/teichoic acid export membrane protein
LGRVFAYAVMFLVPLVNVRTMDIEEYGYYRQFWLLIETFLPMLILGFPRSLQYFWSHADTKEERSAYLTQSVLLPGCAAVLGVLVYAVMAHTLGEGMGSTLRAFFWRLSVITFCLVTTEFMEILFISERRAVAQAVYHFTVAGTQAVCVMAASALTHDVNSIVWTITCFALARFLFGVGYTHSRYRLSLEHVRSRTIRNQLSFAVPLGLAHVALTFIAQTDKFVISRYLGREAFAVYTAGAFQIPFANIVRSSIAYVTFPHLVEYQRIANYGAMVTLWRNAVLKTVVLFFPTFVFLEVMARPFITILFTEAYADATPIFMMYLLLFLHSSADSGALIQAHKRNGFLLKGLLAAFGFNLVLSISLFKAMGRIGVPLATVITMSIYHGVNLWYSAKLCGASFFDLVPVRGLVARFGVALVPGAMIALLVRDRPVTTFVELLAMGLIYGVAYAGICAYTKIFTLADLRSMLGKGRRTR